MAGRGEELLELAAQGLSDKEIADRLCISVRTVEGHWRRLRERTGIPNRAGLIANSCLSESNKRQGELQDENRRLSLEIECLRGQTGTMSQRHSAMEIEGRIRSARLQQEINELYRQVNSLKNQNSGHSELNAIVLKGSVIVYKIEAASPYRCLYMGDSIRALGYRPTEFTDGERPITELFHPEDFESSWAAALDQIRTQTHRIDRKYRLITKRGEERMVLDRCIYEEATPSAPATLSIFAFDVTHTEYADLKASHAHLG